MDKVVVITGANSGIGYAAAKIYESKGYFVVLGCRNEEKGIATEKEIGKNSKFLKLDMTDYESIDNFYNNLTSNFKNIDIFYPKYYLCLQKNQHNNHLFSKTFHLSC